MSTKETLIKVSKQLMSDNRLRDLILNPSCKQDVDKAIQELTLMLEEHVVKLEQEKDLEPCL